MGCNLKDVIIRGEEWQAAQRHEVEFADQARILKAIAKDLGLEPGPAIERLAHRGFDAALDVLAGSARLAASPGAFQQLRSPSPSKLLH